MKARITAVLGLCAALAACGGGGDAAPAAASPTLSGTVATGAAVAGADVLIRDKNNNSYTATTDANGRFSLAQSGMTFPVVVTARGTDASGTRFTLHGFALNGGRNANVNITPLTEAIYFVATNNGFYAPDVWGAQTAAALQTKLQPALASLGVTETVDLLQGNFASNHQGVDALMDLLAVELDEGGIDAAVLRSRLNPRESIRLSGVSTVSGSFTLAQFATVDLGRLEEFTAAFTSLYATGAATLAQAQALFDADYKQLGYTYAQIPAVLQANANLASTRNRVFYQPQIVRCESTAPLICDVNLLARNGSAAAVPNTFVLKQQADKSWKLYGDQRDSAIGVVATALMEADLDSGNASIFSNTLDFYANFSAGLGIKGARIFSVAADPEATTEIASTLDLNGTGDGFYERVVLTNLQRSTIAGNHNQLRVCLYTDPALSALHECKEFWMHGLPLADAVLSPDYFASVNTADLQTFRTWTGSPALPVRWASALKGAQGVALFARVWNSATSHEGNTGELIVLGATQPFSLSLDADLGDAVVAAPDMGRLGLVATDIRGRSFVTYYSYGMSP